MGTGKFELELKCRVITPMFMGGSDGLTPELRPSEFKGMMRWWWRAMKSCKDVSALRDEESLFFGGTGNGQGKSKVALRIINQDVRFEKRSVIEVYPGKIEGLKYILYSTFALKSGGARIIKGFITPGSTFLVRLAAFDEESFRVGISSLWMAIYLGGFGARSRRGGGNLEIIGEPISSGGIRFGFKSQSNSVSDLKSFLESNLYAIKKNLKVCQEVVHDKYTSLHNAKVYLLNPEGSWTSALDTLGSIYKNYRRSLSRMSAKGVFGMPVVIMQRKQKIVPYNAQGRKLSERFASPLIFKVIKISEKAYVPVVIRLSPGGVSKIGVEGRGQTWDFDGTILDDFINRGLSGKVKERLGI
ncbi:MAG: type III-B CRISPR module RAMP protein Cmr1 [candidate division WOR-3 bacterium]